MNVIADTHTLFWFFTKDKKLSDVARMNLLEADKIFIPTIVLLELFRLMYKKKSTGQFKHILDTLKNGSNNLIVSLDLQIIEKVISLPQDLEMHDGIIVATAQLLNAPIITKDETIQKVYPKTLW